MKIASSLDKPDELRAWLERLKAEEITIVDTNVLVYGLLPFTKITRDNASTFWSPPNQSRQRLDWRGLIPHVTILDWISGHRVGYGKRKAIPATTDSINKELWSVGARLGRLDVVKGWLAHLESSASQCLSIETNQEIDLPDDVATAFVRNSREALRSNDARTISAAIKLSAIGGIPVNIVTEDWDFNAVIQMALNQQSSRASVSFERPAAFLERQKIPVAGRERVRLAFKRLHQPPSV